MEVRGLQDITNNLSYDELKNIVDTIDYVHDTENLKEKLEDSVLILFDNHNNYLTLLSEWDCEYNYYNILYSNSDEKTTCYIAVDITKIVEDASYYVAKAICEALANMETIGLVEEIEETTELDEVSDCGMLNFSAYLRARNLKDMAEHLEFLIPKLLDIVNRNKTTMSSRIVNMKNETDTNQLEKAIETIALVDNIDTLVCCSYFRNLNRRLLIAYNNLYKNDILNIGDFTKIGQSV